jgi:hypothetical protein
MIESFSSLWPNVCSRINIHSHEGNITAIFTFSPGRFFGGHNSNNSLFGCFIGGCHNKNDVIVVIYFRPLLQQSQPQSLRNNLSAGPAEAILGIAQAFRDFFVNQKMKTPNPATIPVVAPAPLPPSIQAPPSTQSLSTILT